MFMKSLIWVNAAGLALLFVHPADAQSLNAQDRKFMEEAAKGGMMELHGGHLAMENSSNPAVKAFGQRMVTDHGKGNDELMDLAKKKGVTLPADHPTMPSKLAPKKGKDFDVEYSKMMVEDHQKDIAEFEQEAASGKDPAMKAFAEKYLPVLKHHLQMAHAINTSG